MRVCIAILGATIACSSARTNPSVLTDTTGATFAWSCPQAGCSFDVSASTPALPTDCPSGSVWGWTADTLFWVCYFEPSSVGFTIFGESCRPVSCKTDDDCPWAQFGSGLVYTCQQGLCASSDSLTNANVEQLCLAKNDRPTTCDIDVTRASQVVQQAIQLASTTCPAPASSSCSVPSSCTQP